MAVAPAASVCSLLTLYLGIKIANKVMLLVQSKLCMLIIITPCELEFKSYDFVVGINSLLNHHHNLSNRLFIDLVLLLYKVFVIIA